MTDLAREGDGWRGECSITACPVQIQGVVDGLHWHFRSRYDGWTFEVWREAFGERGELPKEEPIWETGGDYGNPQGFDASYMPVDEAWGRVESAIWDFRAGARTTSATNEGNDVR